MKSEESASPEEGGTYRTDADITIESLEVMNREFAPIEIRQTAGGFSEDSLLQLLTALGDGIFEASAAPQAPEDSTQELPDTPPAGPTPAGMPTLTRAMQEAIVALLADGPYTDMNAVLTYNGEHTLRLDLSYAFDSEFAPATAEQVSLLGILSGLDYTLDAEIPIAAAEELFGQGIIQLGLMQGLLQPTETTYTVSLALAGGTLSINGRPMPIPLAPPAAVPGAAPSG